jgi:prevent-host-death family protein
MQKSTEIGAYNTKTHLAALLREVQAGGHFTITQRGRPVAELVPYGTSRRRARPEAAREMRAFMRNQTPTATVDIKQLIDEGRD